MADDPNAALDGLLGEWLDKEMEEAPTRASALGLEGYDDRLGDFDAASFERRARAARRWAERFEALSPERLAPGGLDLDHSVDRDLVLSVLWGRTVMEDWQAWRRDPSVYLDPCLSGVHTLFVQRLRPEPEVVAAAVARLAQVPSVLDAAARQLSAELASPVILRRAADQCRAGARYFRELLPAEVGDGSDRARLAAAAAPAAAALESFAAHCAEMPAGGSYAIGEPRYSALLRQRELLDFDAAGLHERGRALWAGLDADMDGVARDLGHDSWRVALDDVNARRPATPEEMLAGYREATARCRAFLVERGLVTLPDGEECLVEPSPHFQRPVLAVASYLAPPAFRPSLTGRFFVPFPPDGTAPPELAQRLSTNSYATMPTIAAHEAYPGHHWHLTWSQANPRRLRAVARTSYFVEGWALYAERVMDEAGFFADPSERLCHLDARIFRAARIVVDTGLHAGDLSFDDAVRHMRTHTGLSEATARAEVGRYCAWPTQAASYLTGAVELERMRDRYLGSGRGDVRSFNDAVAATGSLPLTLAERAVFGAA